MYRNFDIEPARKDLSKLYVYFQVTHKACLEIDEEGTTASAVTTVEFSRMSHQTQDFRFDHPFMIFIVDQKNDNILFFGKVANPAE